MEHKKPLLFFGNQDEFFDTLIEKTKETIDSEEIEIHEPQNAGGIQVKIQTLGQCLIISNNLKAMLPVLRENLKINKTNKNKIIILVTSKLTPNALKKLSKAGVTEIINLPVHQKTIEYKIKILLKSITIEKDEIEEDKSLQARKNTTIDEEEDEKTTTFSRSPAVELPEDEKNKRETFQFSDDYLKGDVKENKVPLTKDLFNLSKKERRLSPANDASQKAHEGKQLSISLRNSTYKGMGSKQAPKKVHTDENLYTEKKCPEAEMDLAIEKELHDLPEDNFSEEGKQTSDEANHNNSSPNPSQISPELEHTHKDKSVTSDIEETQSGPVDNTPDFKLHSLPDFNREEIEEAPLFNEFQDLINELEPSDEEEDTSEEIANITETGIQNLLEINELGESAAKFLSLNPQKQVYIEKGDYLLSMFRSDTAFLPDTKLLEVLVLLAETYQKEVFDKYTFLSNFSSNIKNIFDGDLIMLEKVTEKEVKCSYRSDKFKEFNYKNKWLFLKDEKLAQWLETKDEEWHKPTEKFEFLYLVSPLYFDRKVKAYAFFILPPDFNPEHNLLVELFATTLRGLYSNTTEKGTEKDNKLFLISLLIKIANFFKRTVNRIAS